MCLTESCADLLDCSDGNTGFLLREALPVARVQGSQPDRLSLTSDTGHFSHVDVCILHRSHYCYTLYCIILDLHAANRLAGILILLLTSQTLNGYVGQFLGQILFLTSSALIGAVI